MQCVAAGMTDAGVIALARSKLVNGVA